MKVQIITYYRDGTQALVVASKQLSCSTHYFALDSTELRIKRISSRHASVRFVTASPAIESFMKTHQKLIQAKATIEASQCKITTVSSNGYLHDGNQHVNQSDYIVDAGTSDWLEIVWDMAKRYLADYKRSAGIVQSELNPVVEELGLAA